MLRTFDQRPFNDIAHHPEVRPWLGFAIDELPDLTALVRDRNNFCFLTGHMDGGYILAKLQPGLYAAHTLAVPAARGLPMARLMADGFFTMFTATDCIEIITSIPDGAEHARTWSDLAGFRDTFRAEKGTPGQLPLMGEMVGQQFRSLAYGDWLLKSKDARHFGELFHQRVDAARGEASHPEDRVHNAWVGATIGCAIAGNLAKGIGLYNRWACQVGYQGATILSSTPPLVDIGDAIVQLTNGALDVLELKPRSGEVSQF